MNMWPRKNASEPCPEQNISQNKLRCPKQKFPKTHCVHLYKEDSPEHNTMQLQVSVQNFVDVYFFLQIDFMPGVWLAIVPGDVTRFYSEPFPFNLSNCGCSAGEVCTSYSVLVDVEDLCTALNLDKSKDLFYCGGPIVNGIVDCETHEFWQEGGMRPKILVYLCGRQCIRGLQSTMKPQQFRQQPPQKDQKRKHHPKTLHSCLALKPSH